MALIYVSTKQKAKTYSPLRDAIERLDNVSLSVIEQKKQIKQVAEDFTLVKADATEALNRAKNALSIEALKPYAKRSELPDLSVFATREDLTGFVLRQDLKPFVRRQDLAPFAKTADVDNLRQSLQSKANRSEIPDVSTFITGSELRDAVKDKADRLELAPFATKTELGKVEQKIPSLAGFAKKSDLDRFAPRKAIEQIEHDLSGKANKTELSGLVGRNELKPFAKLEDLKPLATKVSLDRLEQKIPDVTGFVLDRDLNDAFRELNQKTEKVAGRLERFAKDGQYCDESETCTIDTRLFRLDNLEEETAKKAPDRSAGDLRWQAYMIHSWNDTFDVRHVQHIGVSDIDSSSYIYLRHFERGRDCNLWIPNWCAYRLKRQAVTVYCYSQENPSISKKSFQLDRPGLWRVARLADAIYVSRSDMID